jgi:hypothetical protein
MSGIGPYLDQPEETWPLLPQGQLDAIGDIALRRVAAIWSSRTAYPRLGLKPWFPITCPIRPTTLHSVWVQGLARLDRSVPTYCLAFEALGSDQFLVGRARLTPLGRRVLEAHR